jgi:hypothetical protein
MNFHEDNYIEHASKLTLFVLMDINVYKAYENVVTWFKTINIYDFFYCGYYFCPVIEKIKLLR